MYCLGSRALIKSMLFAFFVRACQNARYLNCAKPKVSRQLEAAIFITVPLYSKNICILEILGRNQIFFHNVGKFAWRKVKRQ